MNKYVELKKLIASGKIEECIDNLLEISKNFDKSINNNIVLLSGQYVNWKEQDNMNLQPPLSVKNRIEYSILQLIDKIEKENTPTISTDYLKNYRIEKLLDNLKTNIELLSDWEKKKDLSSNPKEIKICEIEIERAKIAIQQYQNEYYTLL